LTHPMFLIINAFSFYFSLSAVSVAVHNRGELSIRSMSCFSEEVWRNQ